MLEQRQHRRPAPSSSCAPARTRCSPSWAGARRPASRSSSTTARPSRAYGDTLQAVRRHAYVDPLRHARRGRPDRPRSVRGPRRQGARERASPPMVRSPRPSFWARLGIAERAARLMAANPERAGEIETGVQRLMSPTGMGELFKVMAVRSPHASAPAALRLELRRCRRPSPPIASPLSDPAGIRPRLLHAPRRRLAGRLCQPQLRARLQGRSGRRAREPRARLPLPRRRTSLLTAHQMHSATAVVVEQAWSPEERPRADAIVTATPGLALGVLTADCAPVLFADPQARVVAAAHAGWRGAIGGVLEATLAAMEGLGARRGRIEAAVGPCIGQPAYEVGFEFEQEFLAARPEQRAILCPPAGRSGRAAAFRPARLCGASPVAGRTRSRATRRPAHMPRRSISSAIGARRPEKSPTTAAKSLPSS